MTMTKLLSLLLPHCLFIHSSGAVGCAGGGCWCSLWVLVIILGWLCLVHVVVVVRQSWVFVGWLSSFLGRQSHFWHWVCVKWYGGDVVGGQMCTVIGRCVVVVASVVGLVHGGCWLKK